MSQNSETGIMEDTSTNGTGSKAPAAGYKSHANPGGSGNPLINVEPPRREDLQPSYAQTLAGESDQGNHGWYGSMSK
jgi:erythrocyte band 7 integral membrane protein